MKASGYETIGVGKIFHDGWRLASRSKRANDPTAWTHFEYCNTAEAQCQAPLDGIEDDGSGYPSELAFGPSPYATKNMGDVIRAKWLGKNVLSQTRDMPFFAAIGLTKPHGPFKVPQAFFDLYPRKSVVYPPGVLDRKGRTLATNRDVADLPPAARDLLRNYGERDHRAILGRDAWLDTVRAYLASVTFTDHVLGLLLDSLLKGPNATNTVIVLWSDHGFQLGEKLGWRKFTLWERACRVPYMIGGHVGGTRIAPGREEAPVSTTSIFPTIAHLANGGVPKGKKLLGRGLDGKSLKGNLLDGDELEGVALTTWMRDTGPKEPEEAPDRHFAVRTRTHRMIAYGAGGRELYDRRVDPYEFNNLMAGSPPDEVRAKVAAMERHLPKPENCVPRAGDPEAG